jgi:hypothetical protein
LRSPGFDASAHGRQFPFAPFGHGLLLAVQQTPGETGLACRVRRQGQVPQGVPRDDGVLMVPSTFCTALTRLPSRSAGLPSEARAGSVTYRVFFAALRAWRLRRGQRRPTAGMNAPRERRGVAPVTAPRPVRPRSRPAGMLGATRRGPATGRPSGARHPLEVFLHGVQQRAGANTEPLQRHKVG